MTESRTEMRGKSRCSSIFILICNVYLLFIGELIDRAMLVAVSGSSERGVVAPHEIRGLQPTSSAYACLHSILGRGRLCCPSGFNSFVLKTPFIADVAQK